MTWAEGSDDNVLPQTLRRWFGPDAGLPGTDFSVVCEAVDDRWTLKPANRPVDEHLESFRRYSREQIPRFFGQEFSQAIWNSGFVVITPEQPRHLCLLVTLDKDGMAENFQYGDRFLPPDYFQWQSQNRTRQDSKHGRLIRDHRALGVDVHLFVRAVKRRNGGGSAPFVYCGPVTFERWEGEGSITVVWRLGQALPVRVASEFSASS